MRLNPGDEIKVHIYNKAFGKGGEIITRNYDRVFEVYKNTDGVLGIFWDVFTPLSAFSLENGAVSFEIVSKAEQNMP